MWYNQKRAKKSSESVQLWIFTPHFSKFRAFKMLHSQKQHVFLEFLVENKAFNFSKWTVHAVPDIQAFRILRSCQKMLNRKHYGHVFARKNLCLKINCLKIFENAKMINWHGQIYPGQQNAKKIILSSLQITVKELIIFQVLLFLTW